MKTELEYWNDLASKAVMEMRTTLESTFASLGYDDELVDRKTKDAMMHKLNINDEEEYEELLASDTSGAYEIYKENNKPLNIYEVGVSGSFSGTFRVKAKDEDEARDYVENNLEVNECTMYLDDDEDLVDDYEEDCMSYDREVEFVNDTGEVYEED